MRNRTKFLVGVALLLTGMAKADCPFMVKCSIDGEYMMVEETYYNGIHKSQKFSHDYNGPNGKEHHYVVVACD